MDLNQQTKQHAVTLHLPISISFPYFAPCKSKFHLARHFSSVRSISAKTHHLNEFFLPSRRLELLLFRAVKNKKGRRLNENCPYKLYHFFLSLSTFTAAYTKTVSVNVIPAIAPIQKYAKLVIVPPQNLSCVIHIKMQHFQSLPLQAPIFL